MQQTSPNFLGKANMLMLQISTQQWAKGGKMSNNNPVFFVTAKPESESIQSSGLARW